MPQNEKIDPALIPANKSYFPSSFSLLTMPLKKFIRNIIKIKSTLLSHQSNEGLDIITQNTVSSSSPAGNNSININSNSANAYSLYSSITSKINHKYHSDDLNNIFVSHILSAEHFSSTPKKVLVHPERAVLQSGDRSYFYTKHVVESPSLLVMPSSTGSNPKEFFLKAGTNDNTNIAEETVESVSVQIPSSSTSKLPLAAHFATPVNPNSSFTDLPHEYNSTAFTDIECSTKETGTPDKSTPRLEPLPQTDRVTAWEIYCHIITFPFFKPVLQILGLVRPEQQKAWREKIGMLSIIFYLTVAVGFLTFGFSSVMCGSTLPRTHFSNIPHDAIVIRGVSFNISELVNHPKITLLNQNVKNVRVQQKKKVSFSLSPGSRVSLLEYAGGKDASLLFQNHPMDSNSCDGIVDYSNSSRQLVNRPGFKQYYPCVLLNIDGTFASPLSPDQKYKKFSSKVPSFSIEFKDSCHFSPSQKNNYYAFPRLKDVYYSWNDIEAASRPLVVYLGEVIDLSRLNLLKDTKLKEPLQSIVANAIKRKGQDISAVISANTQSRKAGKCLLELAKIGVIESESVGCIAAHSIFFLFLAFVFLIVLAKFAFALYFKWFMSWRLGDGFQHLPFMSTAAINESSCCDLSVAINDESSTPELITNGNVTQIYNTKSTLVIKPFYTLFLVTCYSESLNDIRTTLDSLATCAYPNDHKLIFVVCDGLITGNGNQISTPDIALSMMENFIVPRDKTPLHPYIAVATGGKRYNTAKAYAGFYKYDDSTVPQDQQVKIPIVCIIKHGDTWERKAEGVKPGNRGKRDSQVLIMAFLQKVMFNERMCDLENYLYLLIWRLVGRDVMEYETILMVDADTKILPDSLSHLINCMMRDPDIMGLCGETQITNKWESWVTMIQVFEYFISHHLTKSFESVFGGVTCLPGCFSLYRIKVQKGPQGYWVPILVNPDIVERYGENVVMSLHRKNLLLLGEDRYLSTLMLKMFPSRKQIFIPQAKCETLAPSEFRVLLDQRRRWINSTVHNLLELVIVRDLCGVFCLSMQCVVLIELLGTLTLPATLAFTVYMLVRAIVIRPVPLFPLLMLALMLGLPGLLILVTAHDWKYVMWMVIYLLALPVWNFVLPLNAFWKSDDFRWGTTREITSETGISYKEQVRNSEGDDQHEEFDTRRVRKMTFKLWMDTQVQSAGLDLSVGPEGRMSPR